MKTTTNPCRIFLYCLAMLFVFTIKAQTITTFAGNGVAGYSGNGGQATAAQLNAPVGVIADAAGNTYIADYYNNVIRKVNSLGIISTFAGNGTAGFGGDGGQATTASLNGAGAGMVFDAAGNLYFSDEFNQVVRKINTAGIISTIAGTPGSNGYSGDGGQATDAQLYYPAGLVLDAAGNLYIGDYYNQVIRKVNLTTGIITTFAGNGTRGYTGDGGLATAAELNQPWGLAIDATGNIYFADFLNNAVRRVNTAGIISTIAGNGTAGYSGNGGQASAALLNQPSGVVIDGMGNIYIPDAGNNVIREINTAGIISTIAGNGTAGYSGDGGMATAAQLNLPYDVTLSIDALGNLFIADFGNNVVREIINSPNAPGSQGPIGPLITVGAGPNVVLSAGGTNRFEAQPGAISYLWSPTTGLSDSTVSNPYVTVNTTTTYTVRITTSSSTRDYTVQAIVTNFSASCSNWVPNGDFEQHYGCVQDFSMLHFQTNWMDAGGTCDNYTACNYPESHTNFFGFTTYYDYVTYPSNTQGFQTSSVYGNSYAGIISSSYSELYPYFEYTETKLACALITGQRYKMQFDASWANQSNFYCGNIGMLVTTNSVTAGGATGQIIASPQVDGACGATTNWTTFSSIYTGAGEQWVTIGDFDVNSASQGVCTRYANNNIPKASTWTFNPVADYNYNYLDNVIINPIPPDVSTEYTVNCAGLGAPPTNPNNVLTETGSPGNLCSWYGPGGVFLGTGSSVQITTPNLTGTYIYTVSVDLSSECSLCTTPLTNTIAISVLPLTPGSTITPVVTPSVCADYHTGVGTVFGHIVSPIPGTSYIWDPILLGANIHNTSGHLTLPPGVYTVNVSTSNCSGLGTTTFTVNPFPTFSLTASTYTICDVTGSPFQTATITATNPAYNYTWTPAIGTGSVVTTTPTNGGSIYGHNDVYSASAVNSFGCIATETTSILVAIIPNVQVTISNTTGPCSSDHTTYTLSVNNSVLNAGTGGSYLWSTGSTGQSIVEQPTVTTVYSLTETTAVGCMATKYYTLDVIPTPTVSITASTYSVCSGGVPTLTANVVSTVTTPTYAIQYTWLGSGSHNNPYTPTIGLTAPHIYTVQVKTLPGGCISTATVEVGVYPIPPAPVISGHLCLGSSNTVLTVTNSAPGDTYTWTTPVGGSITCDNPSCSQVTVNTIVAGNYTVKYTNANGCSSPVTTFHPNNPPSVTINAPNLGVDCSNSPKTYSLTANVGGTGSTFTWSPGGANSNPLNVTPNTTTVYTVYATNGTTGCSNQATHTIVVTPTPTFSINAPSPICYNSNVTFTATSSVPGPPNPSYTWIGSTITSNLHNNPITIGTHTNTVLTYTLQGSQGGCPANPVTITIYPLPLPIVSAIASPTSICAGNSSVLTGFGASTYTWSPSTTLSSSTGNPVTATPTVSSNYVVKGTDAAGCVGQGIVTVHIIPAPAITITATSHTICEGSHTILTALGATSYTWSTGSTASTITVSPTSDETYTVTGTNAAGCTSTQTITIDVNPNPVISVNSATICTNASATLTANGGTTYVWTPPTGLSATTGSVVTTHNTTTTVYTVTGTTNGCSGTATSTVTVIPPLTITVSPLTTTICIGNTTPLHASGASTYTWSPPATLMGANTANPIANPTTTTVYTVTGTEFGCTGKATATVTVRPLPTITVNSSTICSGSTTTLTAHGGNTYSWSPPSAGLSATTGSVVTAHPNTTTNYTVIGTSTVTGCSASAIATVSVNPTPTITVNSPTICVTTQTTLTATGANSYTWTPNIAITPTTGSIVTVHPLSTIVYTITGTNGNCVGTGTSTVTVVSPHSLTVTPSSPTICAGGSVNLTVSGASSYTWTPASGLSPTTGSVVTANPVNTTTYTVYGTEYNCEETHTVVVNVISSPTLSVNSATICPGSTASLTAIGAITYTWSTGATTSSINVSPITSTDYTVTGTSGGCSSTKTATVTVNPTPTVTVNSPTICIGGTATLTASGASTYSWTPATGLSGSTGISVTANPSVTTTYTVTGTSGSGCVSSAISVVMVNPATNISVNSATICAGSTATLTASGATTYSWTPPSGLSVTTGSTVGASPSSTTVYTVTGATGSCILIPATSTVTVIPFPTVSVNSETICPGSTATLTATGASTYTWTPATGLNTTTGNTVNASPSSTSVYTVTGTSATCSLSSIAVATVTVISPSLTITPSANPVGNGSSITLTASGATTYTWSGLGVTGLQTASVTTPTLSSNTDYTVTGTIGTCTAITVITITVTPCTISFTYSTPTNCSGSGAASNTVCAGQAITITANSTTSNTYTWNPGNLNGSSVTVTPTVTTVYTVDASNTSCGSSNTFTVYVLSDCNVGGGSALTATNTTANNGVYYVSNSFTVTSSLTINTSTVTFAPNVSITVASGASLVISNSHLYAATNSMWQGIIVPPGASITVNQNTMIEDAFVAIDNGGSAGNIYLNQSPSSIQINGAIFNCNYTAIRENYYQSTTPANYGTPYFSINDAVFTCRCGIVQTLGTTPQLNTYTNNITGTANISSPNINDYYSVANYLSATLKAPLLGQPAFEGIHLEGDYTNVGPATGRIYNIVPTTAIDIFDNLVYGINVINSTFSVTASAFQNAQVIYKGGIANGGYGINSNHTLPQIPDDIAVNNSQFINLVTGINNIEYYTMDIHNNTFFSTQVATPLTTTAAPAPAIGQYGMYVSPNMWNFANLSNNTLANLYVGIDFAINANNLSGLGGSGESVATVSVNNNTLVNEFPPTYPSTSYIGNGIIVDNALPLFSGTAVGAVGSEIQIKNNVITNAYRGILARNQQYQLVRDENNIITMIPEPTASPTLITTQYGIEHNKVLFSNASSLGGVMTSTVFPTITNNNITGFITSYTNQPYFEAKKGIWSNLTANTYVTCNTVTNAGRGIEFSGYNQFTYWRTNQMNTCAESFALTSNSGGGIMGSQGNPDASDNQWNGSGFSDTYTDAISLPSNSPLYLRSNILPFGPNVNLSAGTAYGYFNGLNQPYPPSTYQCGTNIPGRSINPTKGNESARIANSGHSSASSLYSPMSLMEKIAIDSLYYMSDSAQNSFINKNIVYRTIKQDTSQMTGSVILHNFYTASQTTCRQLFCTIEDSLYTGNYSYANALVSGYMPSCTIEQNYKRFYQIYMNGMQNTATGADSADLETLASSCPLLNGEIVYNARAFHNSWYKGFKHYEDNCPVSSTGAGYRQTNTASLSTQTHQTPMLSVYPNPNNGKVYISGFDVKETSTSIEITDVTGKLVYKQQNNIGNGVVELNLQLISGVYFVHIINTQGATQIQKIVINN